MKRFKDLRRGYTDKDIESVIQKYKDYEPIPGGIIELTKAELRAAIAEGISYQSMLEKNS